MERQTRDQSRERERGRKQQILSPQVHSYARGLKLNKSVILKGNVIKQNNRESMGSKKKLKSNNNLDWKSVKVEGVIDGDDLAGFAGLEILENYNSSLLKGDGKKRRENFAISELDGDILSSNLIKRSKKCDNGDNESEHEETKDLLVRKEKKKKLPKNTYPGKYVLLKPQHNNNEDYFSDPERATFRSVVI